MKLNKKLGFTLIELLVVITIIAILATVGVNQFGASLQKARDSKRTSDILSLKTAVTQAFTDEQEYPKADSSFSGSVSPYIDLLPKDGKSGQTSNSGGMLDYVYVSGSDDSLIEFAAFEISTAFEAASNIKNVAKTDNGNDGLRKEIGNVILGFNSEAKKETTGTCNSITAVNDSALPGVAVGIIIRGTELCKATHYN